MCSCSSSSRSADAPPASQAPPSGSASARPAKEGAPWAYQGERGPQSWGGLDPEYATCQNGRGQSPVDLSGAAAGNPSQAVTVDYKPTTVQLVNNGHAVQADVAPGSRLIVDGTPYELQQFHFHLPSEHTVQGVGTAMELHFVHKSAEGKLAVLGVLMRAHPGSSPFGALWKSLPAKQDDKAEVPGTVDLTGFLPADRDQFRYIGSLTTPPCSEGVMWTVLEQPVSVTPDEVARYHGLFPVSSRPVQPLNGRDLSLTDQ